MTDAEWRRGMQFVHDEAGGLLRLHAICPEEDAVGLWSFAMVGRQEAIVLREVVRETVERIEGAPSNRPVLCGFCPQTLCPGYIVRVAIPERLDASGVSFALCERGGNPDRQSERALAALRRIWPNRRLITIDDRAAGHA